MRSTVEVSNVGKRFGARWAVRGIDLALAPGRCVGLVGHNGAGKSTLIKLMLGLLRPNEGSVRVLSEDPASGQVAVRAALGYLPENVALHPAMTGAETLAFYARLKRQDLRRNPALLERVGLADAARRRVGTYSKGMRQRLGLAQALLGAPRALLLDEPTSGLDPALRQSFYEILRELRDDGAAILLSSHALAELEGAVDRVVVLDRGGKIADGEIAALRRLAGIRPRIRLRTADPAQDATAHWAGWQRLGDGVLELTCEEDAVAAVLRGLPADARDIEIMRPTLDEVYARFLQGAPVSEPRPPLRPDAPHGEDRPALRRPAMAGPGQAAEPSIAEAAADPMFRS
jgi:Cu-processing system ATP-binding protein